MLPHRLYHFAAAVLPQFRVQRIHVSSSLPILPQLFELVRVTNLTLTSRLRSTNLHHQIDGLPFFDLLTLDSNDTGSTANDPNLVVNNLQFYLALRPRDHLSKAW